VLIELVSNTTFCVVVLCAINLVC